MWRPPKRVVRAVLLAILALVLFSLFQANVPVTAFRRDIVVNVPREVAWNHFANVKAWPSWLDSLESVEVSPDDVLGPTSRATLRMGGATTTFEMAEFEPPEHWMWTSRVGWLTLLYDHIFERISERETRIIFHMRVTGFGKTILARIIDSASKPGHDASFPVLVKEMNSLGQ